MPEAKNVGPQMFDFKHFRNNANGSMVQKTATIAGALAVLSIVSAEVLSNMTQESRWRDASYGANHAFYKSVRALLAELWQGRSRWNRHGDNPQVQKRERLRVR